MTTLPRSKQACGNCTFFERFCEGGKEIKATTDGMCQRYPPTVVADSDGNVDTRSPIVEDYEWCGEWKYRFGGE